MFIAVLLAGERPLLRCFLVGVVCAALTFLLWVAQGAFFAIYLVAYCDTSAMVCVSEERRLDCSRTANPPLLFRVTATCCGRNNMAPKNASDLQCCLSRGTGHGDGEVYRLLMGYECAWW
ncbi:hypothetical protein TcCL_Unassigned05287 [Trypanosoma cruzi]|nr:hypothetical protein TcCL_Unassigned05287 [Trypanosoma cruzi]